MTQEQLYSFNRFGPENEPRGPEHTLLVAILERAILDLADGPLEDRRQAFEWFEGKEGANDRFNFVGICEYLGFDPEKIREGLGPHLAAEGARRYRYIPWGERKGGLHGGWRSNIKAGRTKLTFKRLHGKR